MRIYIPGAKPSLAITAPLQEINSAFSLSERLNFSGIPAEVMPHEFLNQFSVNMLKAASGLVVVGYEAVDALDKDDIYKFASAEDHGKKIFSPNPIPVEHIFPRLVQLDMEVMRGAFDDSEVTVFGKDIEIIRSRLGE